MTSSGIHGDRISLLLFLQNMERRLKIFFCNTRKYLARNSQKLEASVVLTNPEFNASNI
jgi:hypothetical protein